MSRLSNTFRRPALVLVSLLCVFAAGAALWSWISPETIGATRTVYLIALLALFVLPVATLVTMEVDRRHRAPPTRPDTQSMVELKSRRTSPSPGPKTLRHAPRDEGVTPPRRSTRGRPEHAHADHGC